MSDFLPDITGEVLRLEAELVRLARERDRHPPDSAAFERLDAEWADVHRDWHGHKPSLRPGESMAYEVRRHRWNRAT